MTSSFFDLTDSSVSSIYSPYTVKYVGPAGPPGIDGSTWYIFPFDPSSIDNKTGKDRDLWLNNTNGHLFEKINGDWGNTIGSLVGPSGKDGSPGANGSIWHIGYTPPNDNSGSNTDMYLNVTSGLIYRKESNHWEQYGGTLKGPRGENIVSIRYNGEDKVLDSESINFIGDNVRVDDGGYVDGLRTTNVTIDALSIQQNGSIVTHGLKSIKTLNFKGSSIDVTGSIANISISNTISTAGADNSVNCVSLIQDTSRVYMDLRLRTMKAASNKISITPTVEGGEKVLFDINERNLIIQNMMGVLPVNMGGTGIYDIPRKSVLVSNTPNILEIAEVSASDQVLSYDGSRILWRDGTIKVQTIQNSSLVTDVVSILSFGSGFTSSTSNHVTTINGVTNITVTDEGGLPFYVTKLNFTGAGISATHNNGVANINVNALGEVNTLSISGADTSLGFVSLIQSQSKVGTELRLRTLVPGSSKISLVQSNMTSAQKIIVDVNENELLLQNMGGYVPITKGGIGLASIPRKSTLVANDDNIISVAIATNSGQALTFNGANIEWQDHLITIQQNGSSIYGLVKTGMTFNFGSGFNVVNSSNSALITATGNITVLNNNNSFMASKLNFIGVPVVNNSGTADINISLGEVNTISTTLSDNTIGAISIIQSVPKVGSDLRLRTIFPNSNRISISVTNSPEKILFDVNESALNLSNIGGILPTSKGGTGINTIPGKSILVSTTDNTIVPQTATSQYQSPTYDGSNIIWKDHQIKIQKDGVDIYGLKSTSMTLNFTGSGVSISNVSNVATIDINPRLRMNDTENLSNSTPPQPIMNTVDTLYFHGGGVKTSFNTIGNTKIGYINLGASGETNILSITDADSTSEAVSLLQSPPKVGEELRLRTIVPLNNKILIHPLNSGSTVPPGTHVPNGQCVGIGINESQLNIQNMSGTLPLSKGGTGLSSIPNNSILYSKKIDAYNTVMVATSPDPNDSFPVLVGNGSSSLYWKSGALMVKNFKDDVIHHDTNIKLKFTGGLDVIEDAGVTTVSLSGSNTSYYYVGVSFNNTGTTLSNAYGGSILKNGVVYQNSGSPAPSWNSIIGNGNDIKVTHNLNKLIYNVTILQATDPLNQYGNIKSSSEIYRVVYNKHENIKISCGPNTIVIKDLTVGNLGIPSGSPYISTCSVIFIFQMGPY